MSRILVIALLSCGTGAYGSEAQGEPPQMLADDAMPMAASASVSGRWCTGNDDGVVEVSVRGGVLTGKLVESSSKKAKIGMTILRNFKQVDSVWKGEIFAPRKKGFLDASLVKSGGKLRITVETPRGEKKIAWSSC
ncbi:MAG: hypothetical protein AAGA54_22310 [Myxococcota bacterium]